MSKSEKRQARDAILAAWPIHKQLSALCESFDGDTAARDQLVKDVGDIKESYPSLGYNAAQKRSTKAISSIDVDKKIRAASELVDGLEDSDTKTALQNILEVLGGLV